MRDVYDIVTEIIHELNMESEFELEWMAGYGHDSDDDVAAETPNPVPGTNEFNADPLLETELPVENRLYHYERHYLQASDKNYQRIKNILLQSIGSIRKVQIIHKALQVADMHLPIHHLLILSPFWVRDPLTWHETDTRDMLEHLFSEYPAPRSFQGEWYKSRTNINRKWLYWHLILMQGGSLRRAAKLFNWNVYSKLYHHLLQGRRDVCVKEGIVYSEVLRLGGNEQTARIISSNPAFATDITDPCLEESFVMFWYETVYWFINNSGKIDKLVSDPILQWAMHTYTEAERDGKTFSWKGRTVNNVVELSAEYLKEINISGDGYCWDAHGMDWKYQPYSSEVWTINEITSGSELMKEGEIMKHCVITCLDKCLNNVTAIFSMKCNQKRVATIELDWRKKRIIQAYGKMNRMLSPRENDYLNKWKSEAVEKVVPKIKEKLSARTRLLLQQYNFSTIHDYNHAGNTLLHDMVKKGEMDHVKHLLTELKPDVLNADSEIPLMIAVQEQRIDMVRILLKAKPVNEFHEYPQKRILLEAIKGGNILIINELLNTGSTTIDSEILYKAATLKQPVILQHLLGKGADINKADSIERTALFFAIENKNIHAIYKLIYFGAKVDLSSYFEAVKSDVQKIRCIVDSIKPNNSG